MLETLEKGRQAILRHDWRSAVEDLSAADGEDHLSPEDLMLLGDAYWWSGRPDEATEAFERAFDGFSRSNRTNDAATVAVLLAYFASRRRVLSMAAGWARRAHGLLEGQPESSGHAWLKMMEAAQAMFVDNDVEAVLTIAGEGIDIATRQEVPGALGLLMTFKGVALVMKGEWREGIAVIDEANAVAMSAGSGDLRASSDVYCSTIAACSNLADYGRAAEWTEQAERWMKANSVGGFPGVCQVHRAELKRLKGSWPEAEREARGACVELRKFHLLDGLGYANYEIGEVRRRMGDLEAAEEAYTTAYEYGHPAQPGLSLLLLDRGQSEQAMSSIDRALAGVSPEEGPGAGDLLGRGHLLPAQVEIALAAGNVETARRAVAELKKVVDVYDAPSWEATLLTCRGSLLLYEGNAEEAEKCLSRAWRLWQEIELPYEAARAREVLGRARLELGDEMGAALEFKTARSTYQRLGASIDLRRLSEATGETVRGPDTPGERVTKVFMFTDIVTSTDLIGLIGDDAWERLLRWHDRELREIITAQGGEEVRHTGDGFFIAFDDPRAAIDCAVAIQRRLAEHRRDHGFSPRVRIGAHLTEATRERGDYSGGGVHEAARIGDIGDGDEIVVSDALVEAAGRIPYPVSEGDVVSLKGIAEPVTVRRIDWDKAATT